MNKLFLATRALLLGLLLACLSGSTGLGGVFPKAAEPGMIVRITSNKGGFQPEQKAQIKIGEQVADRLDEITGTQAEMFVEVIVPDLPPDSVEVLILRPNKPSVSAGYLKILPKSGLRLILSIQDTFVNLISVQPRSGEFRRSPKPGEQRLSFDIVCAQDSLLFTGAVEHPTLGRFEVYDKPASGEYTIRRMTPQSQAIFTIDIPNFLGKAVEIKFFDVEAGVDLTTSAGREARRPLNRIGLGQTLGASSHIKVQCNGDKPCRHDKKCCTIVLDNRGKNAKYDIVFIGDGFTDKEQEKFNTEVDKAVTALKAMTPFSDLIEAFNIWRVNVVSADSGIYFPSKRMCKNTALDCRYGYPPVIRLIVSDESQKCLMVANEHAPDWDKVVVLVNDTTYGGSGGAEIAYSSISPHLMGRILTHELGHTIGKLGDEYNCLTPNEQVCNKTYDKKEQLPYPNLATTLDLAKFKWGDLILSETHLPTTVDNSPPDVVGAWIGGYYYRFGIYRPQRTCHMDSLASPFCRVCERELRKRILKQYISSIPCQYLATQETFDLIWNKQQKWRWSWPQSLACPKYGALELEDEINYVFKGVPKGFMLEILDESDEVIKVGQRDKRDLTISFRENRAKKYFVELTSPKVLTGKKLKKLEITTKLFRNGKLERLP